MLRRISILSGLILLLSLVPASTVFAQSFAQPQTPHSDPTWQASYWNDQTLSGSPALVRSESVINYNWGSASPVPSINADHFSARWTRYIDLTAGTYRFTAASDDGIRVWADNVLIIDQWNDHALQLFAADQTLTTGSHLIVVEYYENTELAVARVSWELVRIPIFNWRGEYFNNMTLSGAPALVRDDAQIDFNWGSASPAPGINADHFSARWTHTIRPTPGRYRFTAISDDGICAWVDNTLIIDQWNVHALQTFAVDWVLTAGSHPVVVEFYENDGWAGARLSWDLIKIPTPTWHGEYFNNMLLSATPALVRDDAQINFNWGGSFPAPGIVNVNGFSAHWTGQFDLPAGAYRFTLTVDDGARLWVNDHLLIDTWRDQIMQTYSDIFLPGGPIPIKLDYYESTGNAAVQLACTFNTSPGTVIVDDTDLGFTKGGTAAEWYTANEGYGGRLFWIRSEAEVQINYNWARWCPILKPGQYEVFAYIPEYYATSQANYRISHAGGSTQRNVNQSINGGRWVSLGTYQFLGTPNDDVTLEDVMAEPDPTRLIAFDAMKWEPR
ncbi:MAG: hypothetical protein JXA33_05755 [Anaerolineae bacterium]|nr:hypothetical protein [Anaerolineae bacterium]